MHLPQIAIASPPNLGDRRHRTKTIQAPGLIWGLSALNLIF
ncbi:MULTISPECIES: hypothetical protein [unclassified Nostoc]|nr:MULTISPECIES: hypothetical protein [unclassified Nostoc]